MTGGFEPAVLAAIEAVRFGELATYGEIAEEAGHPRAGRAVGNVLARSDGLPWWRIVGAGGRLVSAHAREQAARLRAEGWRVRGGRVQGRDVPGLPPSVSVRPATMDDVAAVTRLIAATEGADLGVVEITRDDVEAEWARPSFDPRRDALLVHDRGRLVGEAEVYRARRAQVVVHPEHRGRGLGSALLVWTEGHASVLGGSKVGQTVADETRGAGALFESRGYRPLWTSWILSMGLTDGLPEPTLPPGVVIRAYRGPEDDGPTHAVIEEAFGEWPDRDPTSLDDWAAVAIRRPSFRPELLRLAVDARAGIVGTALCIDEGGDDGWVQQLAVRRPWRGRGLGRALLQDSFRLFRDLGRTTCGLNTDSRTGALGLYDIGMRVTRSYTHWVKDLPPEGGRGGPTIMKRR